MDNRSVKLESYLATRELNPPLTLCWFYYSSFLLLYGRSLTSVVGYWLIVAIQSLSLASTLIQWHTISISNWQITTYFLIELYYTHYDVGAIFLILAYVKFNWPPDNQLFLSMSNDDELANFSNTFRTCTLSPPHSERKTFSRPCYHDGSHMRIFFLFFIVYQLAINFSRAYWHLCAWWTCSTSIMSITTRTISELRHYLRHPRFILNPILIYGLLSFI